MLEYQEARPEGYAADLIRCAWSLRGSAVPAAPADPIVSDGCVELVFNLADPFELLVAGDGRPRRQPLALVVGPTALPTLVRPTGRIEMIGVRLQPWAGASVLGLPMHALRDRQLALSDVLPGPLADLPHRLEGIETGSDRLRRALAVLPSLLPRSVDPLSKAAVLGIPAGGGDPPSVRELAARLGRTTRTLQRTFAEHVGLGPKTLLRIARVQRALSLARRDPPLRWTTIAMRAGYHDQPHFVRDFTQLVGCLPSEYRQEPDSFTTAFLG